MSEIRERILRTLKESNLSFVEGFEDYEGELVPLRDKSGRYTKGIEVSVPSDDYFDFEPQRGVIVGYENDDSMHSDSFYYVVKLKNGKTKLFSEDDVSLPISYRESSIKESPIDYVGTVSEDNNGNIDTLTMDIPLFLRLLEYAKEDAKTDLDLHYVTENALKCMQGKDKLTMDCYKNIIPSIEQELKQEPKEEVDDDDEI